jgi:Arc/MetJ-type ribon-helix-helix transcriptional regulator
MNLTLKPELTEFIQQEILTGKYASPDEAIEQSSHFVNEAALNLLKSQSATDRLATELREKIDSAAAQLVREAWALPNNGEGSNPEDVLTGLRAKLRTDNPWLAVAGSLVDDPFFDDYVTVLDRYRQEDLI